MNNKTKLGIVLGGIGIVGFALYKMKQKMVEIVSYDPSQNQVKNKLGKWLPVGSTSFGVKVEKAYEQKTPSIGGFVVAVMPSQTAFRVTTNFFGKTISRHYNRKDLKQEFKDEMPAIYNKTKTDCEAAGHNWMASTCPEGAMCITAAPKCVVK